MKTIILLVCLGLLTLWKIILQTKEPVNAFNITESVYLYLLLGLILSFTTMFLIDKHPQTYKQINSLKGMLCVFLLSMIAMYITVLSTTTYIQHIGWLAFVILMGIIIHPFLQIIKQKGDGETIFFTLLIMVIGLTLLAYRLPNMFLGWGSYLIMFLSTLILFEILDLFIGRHEDRQSRNKIYSWIGLGLFSCFLLYDTQRISTLAKYISNKHIIDINYPALSLSIYMDIINLFSSLTGTQQ